MPPNPAPDPGHPPTPGTSEGPRSCFAIDVPAGLLARARSGERAAFEQIYRWFERPVFTLALRINGDREEAAEVLQDTMLKLIGHIGEFRGGASPFWGWLRQIAVNETLMRMRRGKKFAHELSADEDDFAQDAGPLPPAAADAAQLQRALAALPATTRSVLWLYHAEGYTHEEIAGLMQRTASFSKSQLARGTKRLRVMLNVDEVADESTQRLQGINLHCLLPEEFSCRIRSIQHGTRGPTHSRRSRSSLRRQPIGSASRRNSMHGAHRVHQSG